MNITKLVIITIIIVIHLISFKWITIEIFFWIEIVKVFIAWSFVNCNHNFTYSIIIGSNLSWSNRNLELVIISDIKNKLGRYF